MPQAAALEKLGAGQYALSGDLVFDSVPDLLAAGDEAFGGAARTDVDLARVRQVDSAGLALLLEWSMTAHAAGRVVGYRNMPAGLAALAGISDVAELLPAAAPGG